MFEILINWIKFVIGYNHAINKVHQRTNKKNGTKIQDKHQPNKYK